MGNGMRVFSVRGERSKSLAMMAGGWLRFAPVFTVA